MTEIKTDGPPILAVENGELVIKLVAGDVTLVASVNDGKAFFSQVVEKLVSPALVVQRHLRGNKFLVSKPFDNPGDG